jgi:hypothetical protein
MKSRFGRKDAGCVGSGLARAVGFAAVLVATLPQYPASAQVPEVRMGTSFDCSRTGPNIPTLVCQTPELQFADLSQMQAYYTLRHAQPERQQELRNQFTTRIQDLVRDCSAEQVRASGTQPACVARVLGELRTFWFQQIERLANPAALEEARRPVLNFLNAQQALRSQNFLPADALVDGIFGTGTRPAIARYQAERGMQANGFLTAATAEALQNDYATIGLPRRSPQIAQVQPYQRPNINSSPADPGFFVPPQSSAVVQSATTILPTINSPSPLPPINSPSPSSTNYQNSDIGDQNFKIIIIFIFTGVVFVIICSMIEKFLKKMRHSKCPDCRKYWCYEIISSMNEPKTTFEKREKVNYSNGRFGYNSTIFEIGMHHYTKKCKKCEYSDNYQYTYRIPISYFDS